jgi:hypothetical protein
VADLAASKEWLCCAENRRRAELGKILEVVWIHQHGNDLLRELDAIRARLQRRRDDTWERAAGSD